jgi:mannose-6-phosphate isomerase-like protein (cupin superfamily)
MYAINSVDVDCTFVPRVMLAAFAERIVSGKDVDFKDLESLSVERGRKGDAYLEFLRVASMSAGIYVLPAGGVDAQSPHRQDELYYVVRGKARMRAGAEDRWLEPGHIVFVAAHVDHRFYDIEEEFTVLVFFAPAETA